MIGSSFAIVILPPEVVCPERYKFLYFNVGEPKSKALSCVGPILPPTSSLNALLEASGKIGLLPMPIPTLPVGISKSPEALAWIVGEIEPLPAAASVISPFRGGLFGAPHGVPICKLPLPVAPLKNNVESAIVLPPKTRLLFGVV